MILLGSACGMRGDCNRGLAALYSGGPIQANLQSGEGARAPSIQIQPSSIKDHPMKRFAPVFVLLLLATSTLFAQEVPANPSAPPPVNVGKPTELSMRRAGSSRIDLRALSQTPPEKRERPELEEPESTPTAITGVGESPVYVPSVPTRVAPAPPPIGSFAGLDFQNWGAGHPPDTNGDVGPNYYIETINTSIGIYRKSDSVRVAAFTFNTFMSQGNFGNLCDSNNFGDPVVVYDSFEDRWIITDFAFT